MELSERISSCKGEVIDPFVGATFFAVKYLTDEDLIGLIKHIGSTEISKNKKTNQLELSQGYIAKLSMALIIQADYNSMMKEDGRRIGILKYSSTAKPTD